MGGGKGRYNMLPPCPNHASSQPQLPNPAAPCHHPCAPPSLLQANSLDVVLEVAVGASPLKRTCEASAWTLQLSSATGRNLTIVLTRTATMLDETRQPSRSKPREPATRMTCDPTEAR